MKHELIEKNVRENLKHLSERAYQIGKPPFMAIGNKEAYILYQIELEKLNHE